MAALTRVARSSIFPKRSCGAELIEIGEGSSISMLICFLPPRLKPLSSWTSLRGPKGPLFHKTLVRRHCRARCGCDRFYDFWRQAEAHVLGHDLDFLQIVVTLRCEELHHFLDQALGSGSS